MMETESKGAYTYIQSRKSKNIEPELRNKDPSIEIDTQTDK